MKKSILTQVYEYYTNSSNYLNESIEEEGYGITMDNNMFVDLMDMIQTGTYEEIENGHYLIPTSNNSTFHYIANGDCYIDDERGNEYDVVIDDAKLNDLARALGTQYKMVSEGKTPIVGQKQDGEFTVFTMKPGTSEKNGLKAAHAEREKMDAEKAHKNRVNDPEWREKYGKMRKDWVDNPSTTNDPRQKRIPWEKYGDLEESANEEDMYDIQSNEKPDVAQDGLPTGLVKEGIKEKNTIKMNKKVTKINEQELVKMITDITKRCLNESLGFEPEGENNEYIHTPEMNGPDNNIETEYQDWFPENPAEESFPEELSNDEPMGDDYNALLENKEREDMQEKQEKLFSFITENWNNHANNLIK